MRVLIACILAVTVVYGKPTSYVVNEANGIAYRVMYQAKPWNIAKRVCEEDEAKLAVPKSQEEFTFLQQLVRGVQYHDVTDTQYKLLVWLGINNLQDYTVWRNVDGENIEETGYHTWAGNNGDGYSDSAAEPHCVGIDAANPGLRDFWCHKYQPFICQKNTA